MKNTDKTETVAKGNSKTNDKKANRFNITDRMLNSVVVLFFVVVWLLLSFFETAQLYRIESLSLFMDTKMFFKDMMSAPSGLLSYVASYLVQFFHYPVLGAAIYVALLYVAYRLVKKAFDIPARWSLLALLPVTFLLATNTFMGYWIYYMKMPGYYYVAVLGFISMLASLVAYKKMRLWGKFIFLPMSVIIGYPLIGVYSLVGALLMGVHSMINAKNIVARIAMPLLALVLIAAVPALYYYHLYTSTSLILMYGAAVPAYQWTLFGFDWFSGKVWVMWLPFIFLFLNIVIYVSCGKFKEGEKIVKRYTMIQPLLLLIVVAVTWSFWFSDTNFRIELAQDKAMWDEDWERVADLGQVKHTPTRQIVMSRNIALLRTRRAGEEMFRWEDGSAETKSLISVRLAQTGGKMSYYQYGRFNFCYRWCVEDAVEYGWRIEYLKHAVRSLIANGEYTLARRYIDMLKHTTFHKGWAERFDKMIQNPKLVEKEQEIVVPRQLCCYKNTLDVDDSFVEAYLLNVMTSNLFVDQTPLCAEATLMSALIRKDTQLFWNTMIAYLNTHKNLYRIPTHYQEALLLYANIDRRADISKFKFDEKIKKRFSNFTKHTSNYKGMTEKEMAPYFKDDFGDTYWYFYFFIREIMSN